METNALERKAQDGIITRILNKIKYYLPTGKHEREQLKNSLDYRLPALMVNRQLKLLRKKVARRRGYNHIHSRETTVPE